MKTTKLGIKGRMRLAVMQGDVEVSSRDWTPNLLLDQGMNNLATVLLCDLFKFAARGTGVTENTEAVTGTYTLTASTGALERATGARDFTSGDVGKLVRITTSPYTQGIIQTFTNAANVTIRAVGGVALANYTTEIITLFSVQQVELEAESGDRTEEYSAVAGENGTVDAVNVRTLTRTFVFPEEAENHEGSISGTFTWAGTSVTQGGSGCDFTAADVGKYIKFAAADDYCVITAITDTTVNNTVVTVDRSGSAVGSIDLYGSNTYGEIGFSHLEAAGDNINIRVRLENGGGASAPISLLGTNPETAGQRLKITYQMEVSLSPSASTSATAPITDTSPATMSSNKNGDYAIERMGVSRISSDGTTDASLVGLEPSEPAEMALSTIATALAPFDGPTRSAGAQFVALENRPYTDGDFSIISVGTFGVNDAIGSAWRCLGIWDSESSQFLFTFRFDEVQVKDGDHSLTVRFIKSWSRTLS